MYPATTTTRVDRRLGTVVDVHGRSHDGRTVHLCVTGFRPYCFIAVPSSDGDARALLTVLGAALVVAGVQPGVVDRASADALVAGTSPIHSFEFVEHAAIRLSGAYNTGRPERLVRVTFHSSSIMRAAVTLLDTLYTRLLTGTTVAALATALADAARTRYDDDDADDATEPANSPLAFFQPSRANDDVDVDHMDVPPILDGDDDDPDNSDSDDDDVPRDFVEPPRAAVERLRVAASVHGRLARAFRLRDDAPLEIFEADVPLVKRFHIDLGCNPFECLTFTRARAVESPFVDAAFVVPYDALARHGDASTHSELPPVLVLAVDIETAVPEDGASKARDDSVLQICAHLGDPIVDPGGAHTSSVGFHLGSVPPDADIGGERSFAYDNEAAMLRDFFIFVRTARVDVLLGHNSDTFDWPYLYDRAARLRVDPVPIGRSARRPYIRDAHFASRAQGRHEYKTMSVDGLIVLDTLKMFRRSTEPRHKLRGYTLGALSNALIGDTKDAVSYSMIMPLMRTAGGRATLLHYCFKDALLPFQLVGRERLLFRLISLARLCGATPTAVNENGVQGLLKGLFYRRFLTMAVRHVMITRSAADRATMSAGYVGALVMAMMRGLHRFVLVHDFASLYPSIMRTFNTCWTTFVRNRAHAVELFGDRADELTWAVCPDAFPDLPPDEQPRFVKAEVRRGIIPVVLGELQAMRNAAKKRKKEALARAKAARAAGDTATAEAADFDAVRADMDQLAIKVVMNSVYGLLGSSTSWSYLLAIAAFVTAMGRKENTAVKTMVTTEYAASAGVIIESIYGDTDSVFFRVRERPGEAAMTLERAVALGVDIERFVNAREKERYGARDDNVLAVEFEKVYLEYLGITSKRYAGLKAAIEDGRAGELKLASSGLESDRRDAVRLVADVVRRSLGMLLDVSVPDVRERCRRVATYLRHDVIDAIAANRVPWHLFIKSGQLRRRPDEYKGKTRPPHVLVAERVNRRAGADVVKPGDRVPYVAIADATTRRRSEAHEDPEYAWSHRLALDAARYLDEVLPPVARLVAPALIDPLAAPPALFVAADALEHVEEAAVRPRADLAALQALVGSVPPRETLAARPLPLQTSVFGRVRRRCRACTAYVDDAGAELCATHAADAATTAAVDAASTAACERRTTTLVELGAKCAACKGVATPAAAALVADIEDALPCGESACDTFWTRRMEKL